MAKFKSTSASHLRFNLTVGKGAETYRVEPFGEIEIPNEYAHAIKLHGLPMVPTGEYETKMREIESQKKIEAQAELELKQKAEGEARLKAEAQARIEAEARLKVEAEQRQHQQSNQKR
jgi:hypothetical protein